MKCGACDHKLAMRVIYVPKAGDVWERREVVDEAKLREHLRTHARVGV